VLGDLAMNAWLTDSAVAHRIAKNGPAKMIILHKLDYAMHPVLIRRAKIRFQIVDWWPPAAAVAYSPKA
jgi:hypothetical protein